MITASKSAAKICADIEKMISEGAFEDGDKLNEVFLAKQFSVSRTPLREAFLILESIGLIELIPNRGAFVKRPTMERLVEMFEVMAELEAWCVTRAATRITPAQKLYLRQAAADCEAALREEKVGPYYEANHRLHETIYEASGNAVLAEETKRMHRRLRPFRRKQLEMGGRLEQSMGEHTAILKAIESGNGDEAAELMRGHINNLSRTYNDYVQLIGTGTSQKSPS